MNCTLIVNDDAIPATAALVQRLAEHGHTVRFPSGFELADERRDLWLPLTLDGTKTGFDCGLHHVASLADEDPETAARLGAIGTRLLEFGARGPDSVRAATAVLRALCELSGASGWVDEEIIPAEAMPDFLAGVAESNEALEAKLASLPKPTKAEQDAAFKAFQAIRPKPTPERTGGANKVLWICVYVGAAVIGWYLATR